MGANLSDYRPQPTQTVIEALYDLPLGGNWSDLQQALCTFWTDTDDQPDNRDIQLLERHFERALSFLENLPAQQSNWRNALYRMPVPAAVFSAHAEPVDANPAGRRLLGSSGDALAQLGDSSRREVREAITQLNTQPLAALSVATTEGSQLRLFISSLPDSLNSDATLYLAVIISNELPEDANLLLTEQFGLTASEAQLCLRLSSGASLDEIAEKSGVKKNTVRTHLANCFSKLEVNSQAELVSLVLHSVFAATQLELNPPGAPQLTPYLDPELHGYPRYELFTLSDGRKLGYFEYGDPQGVPTFHLHGSLDCGLFAKSQRLDNTGVRLIAVERPGVGESTFHRNVTPDSYATDIMQLADHLEFDAYAVIGRSMGSWDAVALCLADARAQLLVLLSGRLPMTQRSQLEENKPLYRALYNSVWHSATMGRLMLRAMRMQLLVKGPQQFMQEAGLPDIEVALVRDPTYQRHMKAVWLRSGLQGPDPINVHLRLYQQPVDDPPWQDLATPTLLIHGEGDRDVPLEQLLEQTHSFTNRRIILMPGVAHRVVHLAMGEVLRQLAVEWEKNILPVSS